MSLLTLVSAWWRVARAHAFDALLECVRLNGLHAEVGTHGNTFSPSLTKTFAFTWQCLCLEQILLDLSSDEVWLPQFLEYVLATVPCLSLTHF